MNVRELLQIEIWGKRTARRILVGIGIVVSALVVGFGALYAVERYWLTPGERRAGREALMQIDALQNPGSISDEDFSARGKQAEKEIETAQQAAWTARDNNVAFLLSGYLTMTVTDREKIRMTVLEWQRQSSVAGSQQELQKKFDLSGTEVRSLIRLELHKALD